MSEVRVTQVVVEAIVPFTEGNTTTPGVQTTRFDSGQGGRYYAVSPVVDSGIETLSKVLKATRATGRFTNAFIQLYTFDVLEGINLDDLENGTNSTTGPIPLDDTTLVTQSARAQVNCPNACLFAFRIEGDDTGHAVRDEFHEGLVELAVAGVRR